jgi:hypothetical protein
MKVSKAIEMLNNYYDPNEEILIDMYVKSDLDDLYEDQDPLTDDEWMTIVRWGKSLAWYEDIKELGENILRNRKQARSA